MWLDGRRCCLIHCSAKHMRSVSCGLPVPTPAKTYSWQVALLVAWLWCWAQATGLNSIGSVAPTV